MGNITTEILIICLLIIINGLFSMSELAIVSARKNRLLERSEEGDRGAKTALDLAENPNRFLSTVQIGITLIGILSGAFGGATLAEEIGKFFEQYPLISPYSEGIGVGIVVIAITFFSLVLGELVPKRLALNNAEGVAIRVSQTMLFLSRLTTPLVSLLSISTDLVLKGIGAHPTDEPPVTEEDVQSMISQATQNGVFEEVEQEMITQVFRLSDRRVSTLMTPRTEIVYLDIKDTTEEINSTIITSEYSRFPVISGNVDNVIGFVRVKELYDLKMTDQAIDLQTILRPPLFIPDAMTALGALGQMRKVGEEVALVIDEYGGLLGLVSLTDIMEAIVGDIALPKPGADLEFVRRDDGSLLLGGMILVDELKEILSANELPDESNGNYETLGGMMMTVLGKIPSAGDVYEWDDYRFEVVDMDGHRVDKVLIIQNNHGR